MLEIACSERFEQRKGIVVQDLSAVPAALHQWSAVCTTRKTPRKSVKELISDFTLRSIQIAGFAVCKIRIEKCSVPEFLFQSG